LATLKAHPRAPALLLANRGVLAWGNEPIDKLVRFIASLEEVATIAVRAQILGGARALPAGAFEIVQNSIDGD
jgi:L-fuculose-phosphate aldolase/L-ribulose-5-phosphate 4-epimerase